MPPQASSVELRVPFGGAVGFADVASPRAGWIGVGALRWDGDRASETEANAALRRALGLPE